MPICFTFISRTLMFQNTCPCLVSSFIFYFFFFFFMCFSFFPVPYWERTRHNSQKDNLTALHPRTCWKILLAQWLPRRGNCSCTARQAWTDLEPFVWHITSAKHRWVCWTVPNTASWLALGTCCNTSPFCLEILFWMLVHVDANDAKVSHGEGGFAPTQLFRCKSLDLRGTGSCCKVIPPRLLEKTEWVVADHW